MKTNNHLCWQKAQMRGATFHSLFTNRLMISVEQRELGIIESIENVNPVENCHYTAHYPDFRADAKLAS